MPGGMPAKDELVSGHHEVWSAHYNSPQAEGDYTSVADEEAKTLTDDDNVALMTFTPSSILLIDGFSLLKHTSKGGRTLEIISRNSTTP